MTGAKGGKARLCRDDRDGAITLARRHCIYCAPETWATIRRRARKATMPVSRFGVLCCRRADEDGTSGPVEPSGHALVIPQDQQRRFYADIEVIRRAHIIMLDGSEAVGDGVLLSNVMRFLRLTEQEEGR